MSDNLPGLMARAFNVPLCISEGRGQVILGALTRRESWGIEGLTTSTGRRLDRQALVEVAEVARAELAARPAPAASGVAADVAAVGEDPESYPRLNIVSGGVALIAVHGTLVARSGSLRPESGLTGYDGIGALFEDAQADPAVRGIALHVDSGGGEGAGLFDLVDRMLAWRAGGGKPVWAVLADSALSAAYALASVADRITMPRTGLAGSIGVISYHVDFSQALKREGIAVTTVKAGGRKDFLSDLKPLESEARAWLQARVDALHEIFLESVALGRDGRLTAEQARETEARVYGADEAVAIGLVDAVMSPREALEAFRAELAGADGAPLPSTSATMEAQDMDENAKGGTPAQPAAAAPATPAAPAASQPAAAAEPVAPATPAQPETAAPPAADASAVRTDAAAERARIDAILNCEEAKGRAQLAQHFALRTAMSVEDARASLAAAPQEPAKGQLTGKMSGERNPEVGAGDAAADAGGSEAQKLAAEMVATHARAVGREVKTA